MRNKAVLAVSIALALPLISVAQAPAVEDFSTLTKRLQAEKPKFAQRQKSLLAERYDLADRTTKEVTMSRGKPIQDGVRVKLPIGMSWDKLAALTPEEVKSKQLWPAGFLPLPHPHHEAGGMIFPKFLIEETKKQTDRDLARFDLDFDLPDHFLPEFPAPIYLTTRTDLGDVSQGKLVTLTNFNELFKNILNPKQLEGLRLLVTPFPQQQFNATEDRRSLKAHPGVACFDCHANGHTNASTKKRASSVCSKAFVKPAALSLALSENFSFDAPWSKSAASAVHSTLRICPMACTCSPAIFARRSVCFWRSSLRTVGEMGIRRS